VYAVRTLDAGADALKPADLCRTPKLLVKAHLATVARFQLDFPTLYPISYGQELWGGRACMTEYGNPVLAGGPPIQSIADLDGISVPNPRKDGLFPGYLWACREIRRIFAAHGVDKVMPLWVCIGVDPLGTAAMFMTDCGQFMAATRNNPEFCRRTMDLAAEWTIQFGQAVIDMGADCLVLCAYAGIMPIAGNEWMVNYYARIGQALGSQVPIWYALTFEPAISWFPVMVEKGAVGANNFRGWFCAEMDYRKVIDFSREHNLYCCSALSDSLLLHGPVSAIEEDIRRRCEYGKSYPRFAIGIAAVDYTTPILHVERAIAAAKRYGALR
jgi:uroporphyrinogen-III decarboxylase